MNSTDIGSNAVLYLSVLPHFQGILWAVVSFLWANAKPEQDDIVKTNKAGYNFHKHGWNWHVKKNIPIITAGNKFIFSLWIPASIV